MSTASRLQTSRMSSNSALPEQPFISHLIELRDRLIRMVLAVLVVFLALFPFSNDIYVFVADPLMAALPEGTSMIATQVASPFLTPFKLALVTAVFISMPYLLHQFWSFIAPGLYRHEQRLALPLLTSSILLFYLGAAFAYAVVFPLVFTFLTAVTPEGVAMMTDIAHYFDFVLTLFFAFGLAFEVPIATIVLVLAGITTPQRLATKRPYVIVAAFVIGMLLTPPDIISQTLLALPMWLLFEIGLLLSRVLLRKRHSQAADQEHSDGEPAVVAAGSDPGGRSPAGGEMEDEFDRIEQEFDALDAASQGSDANGTAAKSEGAEQSGDEQDLTGLGGLSTARPAEGKGQDRSASEVLVDAKLERVAALRAAEAYDEARRLLYDVLAEGNATQVKVARNILEQLDT